MQGIKRQARLDEEHGDSKTFLYVLILAGPNSAK